MSSSISTSNRKTILIVEDDGDLREMLRVSLAKRYEVIGFSHGEDLTAMVEAYEPALLILDINLPGVDGIGLCRRVRSRFQALPILFMSVNKNDEVFLKTFEAGGNAFIAKPFEMGEMLDQIAEFLRADARPQGKPWRMTSV